MEILILVSGKKINAMVKDHSNGQMETSTKDLGSTIKNRVTENILNKMEIITKDNG